MSTALVKQALAFVDPEENDTKKRKRARVNQRLKSGQGSSHSHKRENKKNKTDIPPEGDRVESNIRKLLALSAPVSKPEVAQKILERAVKGKPLLERVEKKVEIEQSILFPEETFKSFENSYFCK
ncbi:unnamed protein product [Pieris macdunnoughi]|uniref:40S ribosomal protein S19-binding protein 1 n=1 Tax=Pieris macdunnoughi TaxID=345717 RepID=A0A821Y3V7_9NEOP|nr:unnamed protein product [Pieris macdunnoughi]